MKKRKFIFCCQTSPRIAKRTNSLTDDGMFANTGPSKSKTLSANDFIKFDQNKSHRSSVDISKSALLSGQSLQQVRFQQAAGGRQSSQLDNSLQSKKDQERCHYCKAKFGKVFGADKHVCTTCNLQICENCSNKTEQKTR